MFATSCSKAFPFCSAQLCSYAGSSSKTSNASLWSLLKTIHSVLFSRNVFNKSFLYKVYEFQREAKHASWCAFHCCNLLKIAKKNYMIYASISTFPRRAMCHKRCSSAVWNWIRVGSGSVKIRRDGKWCSGERCKMALDSIPQILKSVVIPSNLSNHFFVKTLPSDKLIVYCDWDLAQFTAYHYGRVDHFHKRSLHIFYFPQLNLSFGI